MKKLLFFGLLLIISVAVIRDMGFSDKTPYITVYSSKNDKMLDKFLSTFTATTGIRVNWFNEPGKNLITRLKSEGSKTPADVIILPDAVNLLDANDSQLLMPINARIEELDKAIPEKFREPRGHWFAVAKRNRIIIYNKSKVFGDSIPTTYKALADPKWKGKLVMTSSTAAYNLFMLSSVIYNEGPEEALRWAKGVSANLLRKPSGNDSDQILAVASGEAELSLVNHYYYARFLQIAQKNPNDHKAAEVAKNVGFIFPDQNGKGVLANITGIGISRHSSKMDKAMKFIKFAMTKQGQELFVIEDLEYPVLETASVPDIIKSLGDRKEQEAHITDIAKLAKKALSLSIESGWE